MDSQSRDVVTWILGTVISMSILLGLAVRYVLMPYLREHLIRPVAETRKQVSDNGMKNDPPTLPDMVHDVKRDVGALSRVMDEHMNWSERWTDLIEREVEWLRSQINHHHPENGERKP